MSVKNISLQTDAALADISIVAGTDVVFTTDGTDVANGVHVSAASVVDSRVRPSITLKTKAAKYISADATFTREERRISVTVPKLLADGSLSYNNAQFSSRIHPECTQAEKENLLALICQTLFDADSTAFLLTGSTD